MKYLLIVIQIFLFNAIVQAQNIPTGKEVLLKYLDKIGGLDKLKEIKTVIMEAKGNMAGIEFQTKSYRITPNQLKIIITSPQNKVIRIYNQGQGFVWVDGTKSDLNQEDKDDMKIEAYLMPDLYYLENDYTFVNLGEKSYDKGYYEVEITSPTGEKKYHYYDINTGYLNKYIDSQGNTTYYLEYAQFGDIQIPSKSRFIVADNTTEFTITRYDINASIDDAEFELE